MVFIPMLLLIQAAPQLPESLSMDKVARLTIGMPAKDAAKAWSDLNVKRTAQDDSSEEWMAGDYAAEICRGRVVSASNKLGSDFHTFTTIARAITKELGPANSPDVTSIDAIRPASDPRGASQMTISSTRLTWSFRPAFSLVYNEVNDEHDVLEVLKGDNPCLVE